MENTLHRLELQGFKSFGVKTILEFNARVVGIVGPNGSGKSNIIDALRWVLGEREAKQLRGETLENLIFAGTPKRGAVGMARVSLYFSNHSRMLPFDTEEVVLTRKVDRSGLSEFFLNDVEIKLKDLVPILAKARLGTRGLTMVGQGQSDLFIRSSPADRRVMIEEVLGLKEFRIKKSQAERRLSTSCINMEKVRAMVEELEPHLKFLRRQKTRYERRGEIEHTLRSVENNYASIRLSLLEKELNNAKLPKEKLVAERGVWEDKAREEEEKVHNVERVSESQEDRHFSERTNKLFKERSEYERELARVEAHIELNTPKEGAAVVRSSAELTGELKTFKSEIEVLLEASDLHEVKKVLGSWVIRIEKLWKRDQIPVDNTLKDKAVTLKEKIHTINQGLEELQKEEGVERTKEREANREFRARFTELEKYKNELRRVDMEIRTVMFEEEKIALRRSDLEREWRSWGRSEEEWRVANEKRREEGSESGNLREMEEKMVRLRAEVASIGEIDPNTMKETEETEARHTFLGRELGDLEVATKNLKEVIRDLEEKIHTEFKESFKAVSEEFNKYFNLMFGGGRAKLKLKVKEVPVNPENTEAGNKEEKKDEAENEEKREEDAGIEVELSLPRKRITSLEMLSGGEKSLVSLAALFALISVSPPPFLVLDEIDAPLDESNARRFAELLKEFSKKSQFIIITHNRVTMEVADMLYGITMGDEGVSKVLSLKFEDKS